MKTVDGYKRKYDYFMRWTTGYSRLQMKTVDGYKRKYDYFMR